MMFAVHSTISVFVVLFNASGMYFLRLTSNEGACNQMMILSSLSLCNVMLSIFWIIDALFVYLGARETVYFYRWFPFLAGQYLVWYAMILILTADRLVGCNFPIHHKIFVRREVILRIIGSCWLLGLTFAIVGSCIGYKSLRVEMNIHFWPYLDMFCLALFAGTYGSIFLVMARRRFSLQTTRSSDHNQFLLTVTALLVCFLTLEAIPSIVYAFTTSHSDLFKETVVIIYKINLLCDPLIYIFLQRKVRRIARSKLRSFYASVCLRKANQVYDVEKQTESNSMPVANLKWKRTLNQVQITKEN